MQRKEYTVFLYHRGKRQSTYFRGRLLHINTFHRQIALAARALDCEASEQDIACIEPCVTKAKIYHFSKN